MGVVTIDLAVPDASKSHVAYAAAFIHPAVRGVRFDDTRWTFDLAEPVPESVLSKGLASLVRRFAAATAFRPEPVFALDAGCTGGADSRIASLVQAGAIRAIHSGLFVFRAPVSTLVRFLDHAILARIARPFSAVEETYPNCIPLADLGATSHFASFPEHLHFVAHLIQDLDVLDGFAANASARGAEVRPESRQLSPVLLVHNPSTCYHCYAARRGTTVPGNLAITAIAKCHRFEAANHADLGRLLEFSLREVIFLGSPDYVRATRAQTLELVKSLATDWNLAGELLPSNDPFFTSDFSAKAGQQHRLAMKFEYRATLPGREKKLAIMSSNLHGPTFSKSFALRREGGPLHTGCLGFGLERLALALIAQHGHEIEGWPPGLRRDFDSWRRVDPLSA
jgi:hypothetical protein